MPSIFQSVHQLVGIPGLTVKFVDKVKMGIWRITHTLNSLMVCASTPLEPSITMTAESAAIKGTVGILGEVLVSGVSRILIQNPS